MSPPRAAAPPPAPIRLPPHQVLGGTIHDWLNSGALAFFLWGCLNHWFQ